MANNGGRRANNHQKSAIRYVGVGCMSIPTSEESQYQYRKKDKAKLLCEFYTKDDVDDDTGEEDQTPIVLSILSKTTDDLQSTTRQLPALKRLNYQQQELSTYPRLH